MLSAVSLLSFFKVHNGKRIFMSKLSVICKYCIMSKGMNHGNNTMFLYSI